jgi:pimeloyl-ACP methyl ester carboxylesterase
MPIPAGEARGPAAGAATPSMISVNGIRIEMIERGSGRPLLFLHPGIGIDAGAPVLDRLAAGGRLLAPSHPGFGASEGPRHMTTVDDLSYFYLDLMDQLDLRDATVVGVSFGAWVAAAIAVKSTARIARLVMANAVGIKVGDRETRDIADIFALTDPQLNEIAYWDPKIAARDYKAMPVAAVTAVARNREALGRYGWQPYMHDPKLKGRLHRIRIPTLFLWGTHDRVLTEGYGRAYCAAIPGARFELIDKAGHFPHVEQPQIFADRVLAFAAS